MPSIMTVNFDRHTCKLFPIASVKYLVTVYEKLVPDSSVYLVTVYYAPMYRQMLHPTLEGRVLSRGYLI